MELRLHSITLSAVSLGRWSDSNRCRHPMSIIVIDVTRSPIQCSHVRTVPCNLRGSEGQWLLDPALGTRRRVGRHDFWRGREISPVALLHGRQCSSRVPLLVAANKRDFEPRCPRTRRRPASPHFPSCGGVWLLPPPAPPAPPHITNHHTTPAET